jgi:hypothetical protein
LQDEVSFYGLGLEAKCVAKLEECVRETLSTPSEGHDDPPLIAAFKFTAAATFLGGVPAAAAAGNVAPFHFPQGSADGFCAALMAYVAAQAAPPAEVIGSTVIACSTVQAMQVALAFGLLGQSAWVTAVWAQLPAVQRTPIATLYTPRPRVTNGACVRVLAGPAGLFD